MRISDWSSDVCSSDLAFARLDHIGRWRDFGEEIVPQRAIVRFVKEIAKRFRNRRTDAVGAHFEDRLDRVQLAGRELAVGFALDLWVVHEPETGRASWRERVCQYG